MLQGESGVTKAEETVLFNAHDGTDIFRFGTVFEVIYTDDGFESKLLQIVDDAGGGAVFVEAGHFEVVIL